MREQKIIAVERTECSNRNCRSKNLETIIEPENGKIGEKFCLDCRTTQTWDINVIGKQETKVKSPYEKNYWRHGDPVIRKCVICDEEFETTTARTTCDDECKGRLATLTNIKRGGSRVLFHSKGSKKREKEIRNELDKNKETREEMLIRQWKELRDKAQRLCKGDKKND